MNPDLLEQFLTFQLAGNRRGALALVEAFLDGGGSLHDVLRGVLPQAQRRIGELWEQDKISVAQEHMATAISQLVLAHLYQRADLAEHRGVKILVACVPGEQHDFPARLLADTLDLAGFEVRYLGADVPVEDLLVCVRDEKPDVVALSVTMPFNAGGLRAAFQGVRRATGGKTPVAVGGHACHWSGELAEELGADITAPDATAFVDRIDAMLHERAPSS